MNNRYIFIHKGNSTVNFYLHIETPEADEKVGFAGCSVNEAISKIRKEYGLEHKNINVIDCR